MEYLRAVFGFPDWFGLNWDAVFDLLTDMNWIDAQGYVIVLENEEELDRLDRNELAKFAYVLRSASNFWATNEPEDIEHPRRPLHIVGVSDAGHPLLSLL